MCQRLDVVLINEKPSSYVHNVSSCERKPEKRKYLIVAESAALVKEMINQVAELHPGIKWFHVGADEVCNRLYFLFFNIKSFLYIDRWRPPE